MSSKKELAAKVRAKKEGLGWLLQDFIDTAKDYGIRHPENIQAAGFVICRGKKKPVYLINNSFVITHNTKREEAMADIGGRPCRCVEARKQFAECKLGKLPALFRTIVTNAYYKRQHRETSANLDPNKQRPGLADKASWIKNMYRKVKLILRLKCCYRITRDPRCLFTINASTSRPRCYGGWHRYKNGLAFVNVHITINSTWRNVINKRGLSVVQGYFISDVVRQSTGAGYQSVDPDEALELIDKAIAENGTVDVYYVKEAKISRDPEEAYALNLCLGRLKFIDGISYLVTHR